MRLPGRRPRAATPDEETEPDRQRDNQDRQHEDIRTDLMNAPLRFAVLYSKSP